MDYLWHFLFESHLKTDIYITHADNLIKFKVKLSGSILVKIVD